MTESTVKMLRAAYEEHMSPQNMVRVHFDYEKVRVTSFLLFRLKNGLASDS